MSDFEFLDKPEQAAVVDPLEDGAVNQTENTNTQVQSDGSDSETRKQLAELRELQEAQAAHAFSIQVEDLSRRYPVVRELVERLKSAEEKIPKQRKK